MKKIFAIMFAVFGSFAIAVSASAQAVEQSTVTVTETTKFATHADPTQVKTTKKVVDSKKSAGEVKLEIKLAELALKASIADAKAAAANLDKQRKHEEKLAHDAAVANDPCLGNFLTRPLACSGIGYGVGGTVYVPYTPTYTFGGGGGYIGGTSPYR